MTDQHTSWLTVTGTHLENASSISPDSLEYDTHLDDTSSIASDHAYDTHLNDASSTSSHHANDTHRDDASFISSYHFEYSTVDMSPPSECLVCKTKVPEIDAKYCHECGITTYCSEKCLEEDHPVHTLICKQFENLASAIPPPPGTHRIVIVLPEDDAKPRFMWMAVRKDSEGNEIINMKALGQDFCSDGKVYKVSENLNAVNVHTIRFKIDHEIMMFSCKSKPALAQHNACINLIMNRRAPTPWQGPFVIIARSKNEDTGEYSFQHASVSDLRFTVDFLRTYDTRGVGRNEPFDLEFILRGMYIKSTRQAVLDKGRYSTKVKAVVMSCLGDRNLLGHDKYVQVELKADHYAFDVNCTKISGAISLPMATYILPADETWRRTDGSSGLGFNPYENREITFMHMDISAVDDHWGFANEREWDIRVGSVLIVRKDKKDLTIHHVEAHAVYCSTVLRDHVRVQLDAEKSREIGGKPMTKVEKRNGRFRVISSYMNKAAFSSFFENMKKEKIAGGFGDWASATNPYQ